MARTTRVTVCRSSGSVRPHPTVRETTGVKWNSRGVHDSTSCTSPRGMTAAGPRRWCWSSTAAAEPLRGNEQDVERIVDVPERFADADIFRPSVGNLRLDKAREKVVGPRAVWPGAGCSTLRRSRLPACKNGGMDPRGGGPGRVAGPALPARSFARDRAWLLASSAGRGLHLPEPSPGQAHR